MCDNRQTDETAACSECLKRDKRILELEGMIRVLAEAFDAYEEKIDQRRKAESRTLRMVAKN